MELAEHIANWLARSFTGAEPHVQCASGLGAIFGTTQGDVRPENQDRVIGASLLMPNSNERDFTFYGLCDGMGGGQDGGRCAELTLGYVISQLVTEGVVDPAVRLRKGILRANTKIYDSYRGAGGSTFTGMLFPRSGRAIAMNVGDSRLYRSAGGPTWLGFTQVSEDDTIAGEIAKLKGRPATESDNDHLSNYLAQYVGVGEELEPRSYNDLDNDSDYGFLLTSDGAHSMGVATLGRLFLHAQNPLLALRRLLTVSNWLGGRDNASVVFIPPGVASSMDYPRDNEFAVLRLATAGTSTDIVLPTGLLISSHENNKDAAYNRNQKEQPGRRDVKPKSGKKRNRSNKGKESEGKAQGADKKGVQLDIKIEAVDERSGDSNNGTGSSK